MYVEFSEIKQALDITEPPALTACRKLRGIVGQERLPEDVCVKVASLATDGINTPTIRREAIGVLASASSSQDLQLRLLYPLTNLLVDTDIQVRGSTSVLFQNQALRRPEEIHDLFSRLIAQSGGEKQKALQTLKTSLPTRFSADYLSPPPTGDTNPGGQKVKQ
jgi:hypothetical protein